MALRRCRRLCQSMCFPPELAHTMKLGTQLFNPHRLKAVLTGLLNCQKRRYLQAEDREILTDYMQSATRCFENAVNVNLIGLPQTIEILHALESGLSDIPGADVLKDKILKCVLNSSLSEPDLVHLASSGLKYPTLDHLLEEAAPKVTGIRTKVHLLRFIPQNEIYQYLKHIVHSSSLHLAKSSLRDSDLCILMKVLDGNPLKSILEALEHRITADLETANSLGDRSKVLDRLLKLNEKELVTRCGIHFREQEKSPEQSVRWIALTDGVCQQNELETLLWRFKRDPNWLKNVSDIDLVNMARAVRNSPLRNSIFAMLASVLHRRDFSQLTELLNALGDSFNWIENAEFAEAVVEQVLQRAKGATTPNESTSRWGAFVSAFGVSDFEVIRDKVPPEIHADIMTATSQDPGHNHMNNLFVSKLFRKEDGGSLALLRKILRNLDAKGVFPLHAQTIQFPTSFLVDILDHPRFPERIENFELFTESLRNRPNAGLLDDLELFKRLASGKFPCEHLALGMLPKLTDDTSLDVVCEIFRLCAQVRIPFDQGKCDALLMSRDLRFAPIEVVVELSRNLSSLGMLSTELASRLLKSVLLNTHFESLEEDAKAKLLSSMLSACFMALKRPTDRQLASIRKHMLLRPESIDAFDNAVISEFCHINRIPIMTRLDESEKSRAATYHEPSTDHDDMSSVMNKLNLEPEQVGRNTQAGLTFLSEADMLVDGHQAVLLAGPGSLTSSSNAELTQFMKFRAYVLKHYVAEVRVQLV